MLWNGAVLLATLSTNNEVVTNDKVVVGYHPPDNPDAQINKKYCGIETNNGCRFLFAYRMPEQESQNNKHFMAFTQIARKLNRTMVLTNVGRSRIVSDRSLPFDFYYNFEAFQEAFPDVKFITQKDFQNWTKKRHNKPDVVHAKIERREPRNSVEFPDTYSQLPKSNIMLNEPSFLQLNIGNRSVKAERSQSLMLNFLGKALTLNTEVILIVNDRGILLDPPRSLPYIPYAKHLLDAAERVENKLGKYIAIHWRMEKGKVNMMPKCAERLVNYLKKITSETGIKNIYFATDYPLFHKPQSDTFHELGPKHHQAIKILNSSVHLNTWSSTHSLDYLKNYTDLTKALKEELEGGGLQGILDKLVLIRGTYFISGPKDCCRYQSKYTRRIVEERKKLINRGVKSIKNLVDRWV